MKVFLVINQWNDRHGTSGNSVKVRSTKELAQESMQADIQKYLTEMGVTKEEIQVDRDTEDCVEFDVDQSGTNSSWVIEEHEVDGD